MCGRNYKPYYWSLNAYLKLGSSDYVKYQSKSMTVAKRCLNIHVIQLVNPCELPNKWIRMFSLRIGVAYKHEELIIKVISIKLLRNSFSIPTLRLQEAALTSSLNKPVEGE